MDGIFNDRAAITTGTDTNPPLENNKSGFFLSLIRDAHR